MKTLDLIKPIIYIITGCLIIIFFQKILNILPYVIGTIMILVNVEAIVVDILEHDFSHTGYKIGIITLGILIMTAVRNDFEAICIIWATISIINGGRSLMKSFVDIKESKLSIVAFLIAVLSIVLSIFLILHQTEDHVQTHIILLGCEIILDGVRILIRKYKLKYKSKLDNAMIE